MSHETIHESFEPIRHQDWDRNLQLIREGLLIPPSALQGILDGSIELNDLDPGLQALILRSLSAEENAKQTFVGDGITSTFVLAAAPFAGSEEVYLNGQLMAGGSADYTISGLNINFVLVPNLGDTITVHYQTGSATINLTLLGSISISHREIVTVLPTIEPVVQQIFLYGANKLSGVLEVAKYDVVQLNQIGPSVSVAGGQPDHVALAMTTNAGVIYVWAVGSATDAHRIMKINGSSMAGLAIAMNDPSTVVTSLTTDGGYIYAFMKGGSTLQANSVQKLNAITNAPVGVIGPGVPGIVMSTGSVDMAISLAGNLYVSYSDLDLTSTGEIRKFDVNTGALLKRFAAADFGVAAIRPIRVIPVLDAIFVLDDLTQKIYRLSATDGVSTIASFSFVPTNVCFDDNDLWVSSGDRLYKVSQAGTILSTITPQTGQLVQDIMSGFGIIWNTYSNDLVSVQPNITKIFPGLPGAP
jgi:hypothetical protein